MIKFIQLQTVRKKVYIRSKYTLVLSDSLVCVHRIRPQAPTGLQPSEEDVWSGVAHHPFSERRLAKTAAGPESCHVGRNTRLS